MCYVFPRVARCTFYKYGTGGRQNCKFQWYWSTLSSSTFFKELFHIFLAFSAHEALCILSLNIIIDKVYLVLWFWFVVVALLGIIRVFCRPVQFVSGTIRFHMMKIKMQRWVGYWCMNIILKYHIHKNLVNKDIPTCEVIGLSGFSKAMKILPQSRLT